jgi:hypothetical protein
MAMEATMEPDDTDWRAKVDSIKIDDAITAVMLCLHPNKYSPQEMSVVLISILGLLHSDIDAEDRDYQLNITHEMLRRGNEVIRLFAEDAARKRAEQGRVSP